MLSQDLSKNQIHKIDLIHEALAKRMEKEHTRRSEHITDMDGPVLEKLDAWTPA